MTLNLDLPPSLPVVKFKIQFNNTTRTINALLDTAAAGNFISPRLVADLRLRPDTFPKGRKITLGDGSISHTHASVKIKNGFLYLPDSSTDTLSTQSEEVTVNSDTEVQVTNLPQSRRQRRVAKIAHNHSHRPVAQIQYELTNINAYIFNGIQASNIDLIVGIGDVRKNNLTQVFNSLFRDGALISATTNRVETRSEDTCEGQHAIEEGAKI